jgi:curli biogenesis system outer membrane secretion channel CsgG
MDELLAVELTKDPCITLVERARLQPIIDEIAHCDADNPDRDQFDCSTFAPSGKLLGVQYMVFGDLVMYEPENNAIGVAMRAISVETGKVVGGETINSITPNVDAKLDAHSVVKSAQAGSPTVATLITKAGARIRAWH